jgi:hypothetical protein
MSKHYAYWYAALAVIALIGGIFPMILSGNFSVAPAIAAVIVALVAPPVVIWMAPRLGYPLGRAVTCPSCGTEMPLFRRPTSARQGMWGGYLSQVRHGDGCTGQCAGLTGRGRVKGNKAVGTGAKPDQALMVAS